jgi:dienelactone hydrolase
MRRICLLVFLFTITQTAAAAQPTANDVLNVEASNSHFLIKPNGKYSIGYQDIELLNTRICPDKFYQPDINDSVFNKNNTHHCHEILLRVYYPSSAEIKLGEKYDKSALADDWLVNYYHLNMKEESLLLKNENIQTFTKKYSNPVIGKKFPVIIFMPGSGQQVQMYNNIISQLVSHGYVIIGINSAFSNGQLVSADGQIIPKPKKYNDAQRLQNLSDLSFVLNNIHEIPYEENLRNQMDFNNIGLVGHSMGGMNIVSLLKQSHYNNVHAVCLMDPGNVLWKANYPLSKSVIPTMVIWSSYFKKSSTGSMILGKNNYSIELRLTNANYHFSNHENFSDLSTLQYNASFQIPKIHRGLTNSDFMGVGYSNGYKISKEINQYILTFLNLYLKNIQSETLENCKAISKNSNILCGD